MQPRDKEPSGWTHPIHGRGVKSPWPSAQVRGQLTDKDIERYALRGFYGSEVKLRYQAIVAARKKNKKTKGSQLKKLLSFIESLCQDLPPS